MTNEMIHEKAMQYKMLQAQKKDLEAMLESLKQDMITEMDNRKVEKLDVDGFSLRYNVYSKQSVDSNKLKADGLYEKYSKETTYTRFEIR